MSASANEAGDEGQAPQNYPSPVTDGLEAGPFYSTAPVAMNDVNGSTEQSREEEHSTPTSGPTNGLTHPKSEPGLSVVEAHDAPPGNSGEVASPSSFAHGSHRTHLEELKLAAQLGHGLAVAAASQQLSDDMGDSDMSLHGHSPRNDVPHPEPEPHDQPSFETPQANDDTAQQPHEHQNEQEILSELQDQPPMPMGPPLSAPYPIMDGIPPRKRSKVSRACDECRRKKIKCDAQADFSEQSCSNCFRLSIACQFSRIPQKRGPNKGYIKELADRIHSIESKLGSDHGLSREELDRLLSPDRPRANGNPSANGESSRKRPFFSISADKDSPSAGGAAEASASVSYSNASLAPTPVEPKPNQTSNDVEDVEDATSQTTVDDDDITPEVEEAPLHDFLTTCQAVYPILPNSKDRVQALLDQCPSPIRKAFILALLAVTQSPGGDAALASSLLNKWESSENSANTATNLVHAQTLLLLTIDADWRSPQTLPFYLSRAVALAHSLKMWKFTPSEFVTELDSDEQLRVRIWWSLVLMDRWHAAGTGKPVQIPDSSVVAPTGLENVVGEVCYHLIRLSKLLNRISYVLLTLSAGNGPVRVDPFMASVLADYIENYREDLPAHIEPDSCPLVHLAYWHCRLLILLLTPSAIPAEIFWATKELANLLSTNAELRSPLMNHFASLAALALGRLIRTDSRREEALELVREILDKPGGKVWDNVQERLAEQLRRSPTSGETAAATAPAADSANHELQDRVENAGTASSSEEAASMLAQGYLETS